MQCNICTHTYTYTDKHIYTSNFVCRDRTAFFFFNFFKSYLNDVFCNNINQFILTCWTHFDLLDFNSEETETVLSEFLNSHDAKSMVKVKASKALTTLHVSIYWSQIKKCFKSATTIDTGLSYFHKMALVVLKKKFEKPKPKVISYRD